MQGSQPSAVSTGKARLHGFSDRTLPPRVKQLLQGVQRQFGDELERGLLNTLSEYESQLFKLAEAARSSGIQAHYMAALREVRSHGGELPRSVLKALESALATLRDKVIAPTAQPVADLHHGSLSLVENVYMDEHTVINEIAGRTELRNSLALFLLGQRFGVLAGKPGYEAETLPVGPHALAQMVAQAMGSMDLSSEHRQLLLRQFDKQVLQFLGPMLEGLNIWLGQQGVLPHITHVPVRARPQDQSSASAKPAAAPAAPAAAPSASDKVAEAPAKPLFEQVPLEPPETRYAVPEPEPEAADGAPGVSEAAPARWPGMPTGSPGDAAQDAMAFQTLRQLLAGRRSLMGKLGGRTSFVSEPAHTASSEDLNVVLDRMQHLAAAPVMRQGKAVTRTIAHLKQDMLMQLRAGQSDGAAVALPAEENDTIELVGMLLDHLMRDLRPGSPASSLLTKLQIPLLRVALGDKRFFTQADHPARQLLNTVAETADWFASNDPQDKALLERMRLVVDRVVSDYRGDNNLFESLISDVHQHLQVQVRRAEVAEKRHVEAARGKEKLELARVEANQAIERLLSERRVPRFISGLLAQSWSDVLALSMLRHGSESDEVAHQIEIAQRIIETAERRSESGSSAALDGDAEQLRADIESGLLQVGYHADDAQAVSTRLVLGSEAGEADGASRTELTARLKQRTRFGEQVGGEGVLKPDQLSEAERAEYEHLKRLPFGSWFEFTDADGQPSRRRMSWFSPITGHCLFVNHRGHRLAELALTEVAREMVAGRVKLIGDGSTSLVDRAWKAIVGALRSFAGGKANEAQA